MKKLNILMNTIPFTSVTLAELIVFSKKPISIVTRNFLPRFDVSESLHARCIPTRGHKLKQNELSKKLVPEAKTKYLR